MHAAQHAFNTDLTVGQRPHHLSLPITIDPAAGKPSLNCASMTHKSASSRMSLSLPQGAATITPASSLPPSPGSTMLLPAAHIEPALPRKVLLMPTVRRPRVSVAPAHVPRPARFRHHASPKMSRTKQMSLPSVVLEPEALGNPLDASHWFNTPRKFEVVTEHLELSGFQLYAVEKWCVVLSVRLLSVTHQNDLF
jgi:hypothetical protein